VRPTHCTLVLFPTCTSEKFYFTKNWNGTNHLQWPIRLPCCRIRHVKRNTWCFRFSKRRQRRPNSVFHNSAYGDDLYTDRACKDEDPWGHNAGNVHTDHAYLSAFWKSAYHICTDCACNRALGNSAHCNVDDSGGVRNRMRSYRRRRNKPL
jgi:hypothetical protein